MKNYEFLKKRITLCCALIIVAPLFAQSEAIENIQLIKKKIEAGFKSKVLALTAELVSWPDEEKSKLRFNISNLHTTLSIPGRFKAICANDEKLMLLNSRMAAVLQSDISTVYLDCTNFSMKDWESYFKSNFNVDPTSVENIYMKYFIHQALRVMDINIENEDDYSISSSVFDILEDLNQLVGRRLSKLIRNQYRNCEININFTVLSKLFLESRKSVDLAKLGVFRADHQIDLVVKNHIEDSIVVNLEATHKNLKLALENGVEQAELENNIFISKGNDLAQLKVLESARLRLYKKAAQRHCFEKD